MNIQNNLQTNNSKCCVDYCETMFDAPGNEVVNAYRCNQSSFTAAEVWNIKGSRRQLHTNNLLPSITVH